MTLLSTRRVIACVALTAGAALGVPAQAAPAQQTYIVTLAPGSPAPAVVAGLSKALGGQVGFVYQHALKGFSVTLPVPALPQLLRLPGVTGVEVSHPVAADTTQAPTPSYGLDRINARTGLDGRYSYTATGAGVTAYVVDTGILTSHTDFGRRASAAFDAMAPSTRGQDCNGHGTHVAGTIGGTRYGVAKAVSLVAVRVLDCDANGTDATVIAGLDWVAGHARRPAVVNMSLGGGASAALDRAVEGVIAKGVAVAVAAGNDGSLINDLLGWSDACSSSPARVPSALTVAATDDKDARAGYSNTGACVDLWAPGSDITSDWADDAYATNTISGTSMATPHVVGVAALFLTRNRAASPAQVASAILGSATTGVVANAGASTPNRLLYSRY